MELPVQIVSPLSKNRVTPRIPSLSKKPARGEPATNRQVIADKMADVAESIDDTYSIESEKSKETIDDTEPDEPPINDATAQIPGSTLNPLYVNNEAAICNLKPKEYTGTSSVEHEKESDQIKNIEDSQQSIQSISLASFTEETSPILKNELQSPSKEIVLDFYYRQEEPATVSNNIDENPLKDANKDSDITKNIRKTMLGFLKGFSSKENIASKGSEDEKKTGNQKSASKLKKSLENLVISGPTLIGRAPQLSETAVPIVAAVPEAQTAHPNIQHYKPPPLPVTRERMEELEKKIESLSFMVKQIQKDNEEMKIRLKKLES